MRIRRYRYEDTPTLYTIHQVAARFDTVEVKSEADFAAWLKHPELDAPSNVFVITDDDDELHTWGQGETLEGIEGEIVGYTIVQLRQRPAAYHLLCQGTVHPHYRRRNAGRALLICGLSRARVLAAEFEFEAEQEGHPVYFEALLPVLDPASAHLAVRCEMQPTDEPAPEGMQLYRQQL